ncbi:hypothetical protein [Ottowia caeni]
MQAERQIGSRDPHVAQGPRVDVGAAVIGAAGVSFPPSVSDDRALGRA